MIISNRHKFIVFAPWKCASQTLHFRMAQLNESPYPRFFYQNEHLGRMANQHLTCADFQALPESRHGYRSACFVRNPYDRAYSGFLQQQRDAASFPKLKFEEPWQRDLVLQHLDRSRQRLKLAGGDFDRWVKLMEDHEVHHVGSSLVFLLHPMRYWTHVGSQQFVDFIGRVENFDEDFSRLTSSWSLPVQNQHANKNVSEGSANCLNGYRHVAKMNQASLDRLNALFSDDFERFGYEKAKTANPGGKKFIALPKLSLWPRGWFRR